MRTKFFLTTGILSGIVAVFVASYLKWAVKRLTNYHPDFFVCYWLALAGCLANLFLPFSYRIFITPYRKLLPWMELSVLNLVGFSVCLLLYWLGIRSSGERVLSLPKAFLVTGGQYIVFITLSYWI